MVLEAASGLSSLESLQSAARGGSSSRTSQATPPNGSDPSERLWNDSDTQRYRSRLRQLIAEHPTDAHAFSSSGLLPTAKATDADRGDCPSERKRRSPMLASKLRMLPTLMTTRASYMTYETKGGRKTVLMLSGMVDGPLSPRWLEWFMGFPDGWITSVP